MSMQVQFTCTNCGSSIEVIPSEAAKHIQCSICLQNQDVHFTVEHEQGVLKECPCCQRHDFYSQKDFNRKIGVTLFVIAAIASIFTYGLSFFVLWIFDYFLFKKLGSIAICYKCQTIFRKVSNINEIRPFDHEMNDRIIYSDHDFKGRPLSH